MTNRQEADGFDGGVELSKRMRREAAQAKGHTPKPWRVENPKGRFTAVFITNDDGNGVIARVNLSRGGTNAPYEGEANAALITAAPDMLEVLESLLSWAEYMGGWEDPAWKQARAAVKRAKGAA